MDRKVLGKGLSALIPEGTQLKERIQTVDINKIKLSDNQPRSYFSEARLKELSESIREKGVIQPILVRPVGESFQIIAGERRFRAAKMLGVKEIPAMVKQVADEDALEIALIENIQREELTKIEEAKAYRRLCEEHHLTHEDISRKVAKERASITNILRLLELPDKIQSFLEENTITMGHAKALLSLDTPKDQSRICDRIIKRGLSVRQSENLVRTKLGGVGQKKKKTPKDIHLGSLEDRLQHKFGTRVKIFQGKKRGKIIIDFYSNDDLNRLITLLKTET